MVSPGRGIDDKLVPVQNVSPAQELERSSILDTVSHDLVLDFIGGTETFSSRTEVRFRCKRAGAAAFADLQAVSVRRAVQPQPSKLVLSVRFPSPAPPVTAEDQPLEDRSEW